MEREKKNKIRGFLQWKTDSKSEVIFLPDENGLFLLDKNGIISLEDKVVVGRFNIQSPDNQ